MSAAKFASVAIDFPTPRPKLLLRNLHQVPSKRGRHGFDVDRETLSACRGTDYLVKPAVNLIVANDDNYALAA